MDGNLVSICMIAFGMVFLLLTVLAAVMRLIMIFFPYDPSEEKPKPQRITTQPAAPGAFDPALVAVVTTAVAAAYPGARISKLEEIK
ncbi:OadG family transporter subunit [candidate division KSB1 bacterium]